MKISEIYALGKSQYELDFVDIDPTMDTHLFIDPYFLSLRTDSWSISASRTIRSFFSHFLDLVRTGNLQSAREMFNYLHEPNETCLGFSVGTPSGRGIGNDDASRIFESLIESKAIKTGMIEDIEDCRIFVNGIDKDKISDMATNIIRKHLIDYTIIQCENWNIPLTKNAPSGFSWSRETRRWSTSFTKMLIINERAILLVPKSIVSYAFKYSASQYHQHFLLNYLKNEHLRMNSILVQRRWLKNGSEKVWVTKESVKDYEAPLDKNYLVEFTEAHPEIFANFKKNARKQHSLGSIGELKAITNEELCNTQLSEIITHLISQLRSTEPGKKDATRYHKIVTGILELLFYPRLTCPDVEVNTHGGRKRIDITFDNSASEGFFWRVHNTYQTPAQFVVVECKNYNGDIKNPELDQISGRFSMNRGKVGLIVCRAIKDMDLFLLRCGDTYKDGRGIVLPIVDDDLISLLKMREEGFEYPYEELLQERYRKVAHN